MKRPIKWRYLWITIGLIALAGLAAVLPTDPLGFIALLLAMAAAFATIITFGLFVASIITSFIAPPAPDQSVNRNGIGPGALLFLSATCLLIFASFFWTDTAPIIVYWLIALPLGVVFGVLGLSELFSKK